MVAVRFIFDVDGVILDSIPAYQKAWAAWAKEYCVDEEAIWAVAHGRRPADIIRSVAGRVDATASLKRFENLIQVEYETVASTPATTPRSASRRRLNDRATTGPAHPGA
jgi:beta-phosphoglucomutase-like phosphatase (HAD superfamily)